MKISFETMLDPKQWTQILMIHLRAETVVALRLAETVVVLRLAETESD